MPVGFDVEINKSLKEGFLSVIWRNPGANTENSFEAETPVFKKEHIHTDSLWPNAKQALETGTRLFNFLDGGGDFRRALKEAEFRDQPLQLGISTCKETHDWPLELVAHNGVFLLCGKCLLVRKAVGRNGDKKIVAQKRPLKLLFMAGSPLDVQPLLGFEKEEEMIFDVIEKTAVDLEVEDSGTLEGLAERLQHEAYDVVHLSGHADIDKNGVPFFILETETGGRRDVSCELLWNAALKKNPPRLLFLSGCRTGEAAGDGAVSFARVMVETYDIPAVLGWGRSVRDVQASIAARKIYGELSLGRSVPEAVKQARFILMEHFARHPEWPLLRLFSWGGQVGALVEEGQKAKPKPRILKHKYLADSSVKVLAEGFVGRRRQLQQCIRVLTEENDNIGVLIQGTGGLGKSCLAGKVCERFSNHHLIVVHGVFNDISLHNALDRAFSEVGDEQGKEILQAEKKMTEKLQALCAGSFKNKKYLFVLDDFERNIKGATEGAPGSLTVSAAQLLTVLLYSLPACNKETQLIITCRYDFSLARQSADLVTQRLQVVTLTGFLHAEQLKKVRELRHIINYPDAETARKLTSAGCGNPRLMESLDLLVGQMGQAEVPVLLEAVADKKEEFIRKHVVRELVAKGGEGFDVFVSGFGIYRVPVATNGAKIIGKSMDLTDRETGELLERGVGLGLVEYDQARGVFQVTPLLREELVAAVSEAVGLHRAAFGYFKEHCEANIKKEKFETVRVEELVYHALACGEEEEASQWGGRLVKMLGKSLAFAESRRVGEWVLARKKQPLTKKQDAFLLNETGLTFWNLGENRKAIQYYEQALEIVREVFGNRHSEVAVRLNNLGMARQALGNYRKAIEYFEQALEIDREVFGNRHAKVAIRLNNLGGARDALGDYRKAAEYYEQALEINREVFGNRHADVAVALNNLGLARAALGDTRKAIEYYEQALEIDREVFGDRHPAVARELNNLGMAWDAPGDNRKAIEYFEQALDIDREVFGNRHPDVATDLNNLGSLYFEQGKIGKAKELLQQAYDIRREFLGPEHHLTKETAEWLEHC